MDKSPTPGASMAIAALALFSIWITWRAKGLEMRTLGQDRAHELVNKPAPQFNLPSLDGQTVSLAQYHGNKKVVVSYWASWCGPCRMELPVLRSFYQRAHNSTADFEILAVSIDQDRQAAEEFANQERLPFPVLLDSSGRTAESYLVDGIPSLFVIDKNGRVAAVHAGFNAGLEFMLANELGIRNYTPAMGGQHAAGH